MAVEYLDEHGQEKRLEASGYIAGMLQHEADHLWGKLFVDHVKPGKKSLSCVCVCVFTLIISSLSAL